jgi:hypothetical protein
VGVRPNAGPPPPVTPHRRWRLIAAAATALVLAGAGLTVLLWPSGDQGSGGGAPAAGPSVSTPASAPVATTAPGTGTASAAPSQPAVPGFGYQPLWPFTGLADAAAWQRSYREGGHQPWHLDVAESALSFTRGFLGYTDIDRVVGTSVSGRQAWVSVGYADPNGRPAAAAVLHLARIGTGADAPWEVVGSRDSTLTLTRPGYGTAVTSPMTVGGRVTGVDENLVVQVRAIGLPLLGRSAGIPAGGQRTPWSGDVAFTAPAGTVLTGTVLTVAVSTGGHLLGVERFAITGVVAGSAPHQFSAGTAAPRRGAPALPWRHYRPGAPASPRTSPQFSA